MPTFSLLKRFDCRHAERSRSPSRPPMRLSRPSYKPTSESPAALLPRNNTDKGTRLGSIRSNVFRRLRSLKIRSTHAKSANLAVRSPSVDSSHTVDGQDLPVIEPTQPEQIPLSVRRKQLRALHALGSDQTAAISSHNQRLDAQIVEAKQGWKSALDAAKESLKSSELSILDDNVEAASGGSGLCKMRIRRIHSSGIRSPSTDSKNRLVTNHSSMTSLPTARGGLHPSHAVVNAMESSSLPVCKPASCSSTIHHETACMSTGSRAIAAEKSGEGHTANHVIAFDRNEQFLANVTMRVRKQGNEARKRVSVARTGGTENWSLEPVFEDANRSVMDRPSYARARLAAQPATRAAPKVSK